MRSYAAVVSESTASAAVSPQPRRHPDSIAEPSSTEPKQPQTTSTTVQRRGPFRGLQQHCRHHTTWNEIKATAHKPVVCLWGLHEGCRDGNTSTICLSCDRCGATACYRCHHRDRKINLHSRRANSSDMKRVWGGVTEFERVKENGFAEDDRSRAAHQARRVAKHGGVVEL